MEIITLIHSWFRWVVLIAGIITAGKGLINLVGKSIYDHRDKVLFTLLIRTLEIQTALGGILIIWQIFFQKPDILLLFHGFVGLLPVALAHRMTAWQIKWSSQSRSKNTLLGIFGVFLLIIGAIYLIPEPSYAETHTTFKGHSEAVRSVEFSPDGKTLATGSFDGSIRIWDAREGTEILEIQAHEEAVRDIAFSPDGRKIASVSFNQELKIWDLPGGEALFSTPAHQASINKVLFSPLEDRIYTTSLDNTISIWDLESGELIKSIDNDHQGGILSLALSPDGNLLASSGIDGTIRIYDAGGETTAYLGAHTSWAYDLDFSPDGKHLASTSLDKTVIIWDLTDTANKIQLDNLEEAAQSVAFSPDGSILLAGSANGKIYVWQTTEYHLVDKLNAHQRSVLDLDYSKDGMWFASGSADSSAILWNVMQR